ncbi:copper homeostasis membrane protein CopD (plasmid) [Sphingomonas bisphenolicum]
MPDIIAIAVRLGLYLDLMLLFGLPMFGLYTLRGTERASGSVLRFRPVLATIALAGIVLSILGMIALAASMGGVPVDQVDRATVNLLISGTAIGTVWQVRVAALLLVLYFSIVGWRRPAFALWSVSVTAAIALATLAWTGHGAADEGLWGWIHLGADITHLLAAGIWIGALSALCLLIFRPAARMAIDHVHLSHRALDGFAKVGSIVVGLLILSGFINSWILVGPSNLAALFTSLYGVLLAVKLVLFGAMLFLAAANRFFLTPALAGAIETGDISSAIGSLRRSLIVESGCALTILALVAWLGLLAPPASGM